MMKAAQKSLLSFFFVQGKKNRVVAVPKMESLIICGEFRYNWLNSVSPYLDQGCSDNKEGFSF